MEKCKHCGAQVREQMERCPYCGEKYDRGSEKAVRCQGCGTELEAKDHFCPKCGRPCRIEEKMEKNSLEFKRNAISTPKEAPQTSEINGKCLGAVIGCAALWCVAPFIAVNIATLGEQPTALEVVTDSVSHIGDLTRTLAFLGAILSLIGIVICFLSVLSKANGITRIAAILTEGMMIFIAFSSGRRMDGIEDVLEFYGWGFWGILFLILGVIVFSGKKQAA